MVTTKEEVLSGPVSYTHLDVYKRQALRMGFLPRSNSAKLVPGMGGKDVDLSLIHISLYFRYF